MASVRLNLAYHGARFAGWAVQPGERTVQGELEAVLERILGAPTPLTVAGRTDAGVHAWGRWRASSRTATLRPSWPGRSTR